MGSGTSSPRADSICGSGPTGSRRLFIYWEKLRAERAYPGRSEIDLGDLRELMPDLVVVEKDHLRKTCRFRLAGTRVCDLFQKKSYVAGHA